MSDSEFETTSPYTPNSCLKRRRLRSLPPSNKTSELFAAGGILDSQTTDTQWEENLLNPHLDSYLEHGISQLNYLELQRRQSGRQSESLSSSSSSSPSTTGPNPCLAASLAEKVHGIVELHMKEVEEDVRRQVEGKVRTEVEALRARVDLLCEELYRERRWIRTLEESLQENNITFPSYPRN
ncbi:hypothetical protein BDZ97DRAFT_1924530 [Flammula alnicola]|nr:hypothetical protein BDZ97DRAFT_1924530 [Flammula alnicola]